MSDGLVPYPFVMEKEGRAATSRDSDKYIVRFPPGMRQRLHEAARENNRTLNAELIARLQASLDAGTSFAKPNLEQLARDVSEIKEAVRRLPHMPQDAQRALELLEGGSFLNPPVPASAKPASRKKVKR